MILYHSSQLVVPKPDISFSRKALDFGKGFYTTPIKTQAEHWAQTIKKRQKVQTFISVYKTDETVLRSNCRILEFATYSYEWLDFVTNCRKCLVDSKAYDVIIGSVANDIVFEALEAYFNGYDDKEKAINRLRYAKPNLQYCFKSQDVIDKYLTFQRSEEVQWQ
jgi:hypothetical protein